MVQLQQKFYTSSIKLVLTCKSITTTITWNAASTRPCSSGPWWIGWGSSRSSCSSRTKRCTTLYHKTKKMQHKILHNKLGFMSYLDTRSFVHDFFSDGNKGKWNLTSLPLQPVQHFGSHLQLFLPLQRGQMLSLDHGQAIQAQVFHAQVFLNCHFTIFDLQVCAKAF